jgi:hypothetical protein
VRFETFHRLFLRPSPVPATGSDIGVPSLPTPCTCAERPSIEKVNETIHKVHAGFTQISRNEALQLLECLECGQFWKVDFYEKGHFRLALKVDTPSELEDYESERREIYKKACLFVSRGGLDSGECLWQGCLATQLKGSAFCLHHTPS